MKLLKRSPRFARFLWLLTMTVCAVRAHAASEAVDPLTGDWLYHDNQSVTFKADGTVTNTNDGSSGTWDYLHNPEVQRHYRVIWSHGKYIDGLVLSENGQSMHIHNEAGGNGNRYEGRRAIPNKPAAPTSASPAAVAATPAGADAADPILGDWLWAMGRPVTFRADGTVVSPKNPQGVWEFLHNPEAERKYRVTWGGGKFVDTLSYTRDATAGRVLNLKGKEYDVRRGAPAAPAPSGPDSHPFGTTR